MNLLTRLNEEGTTIVMVTHSQQHAEYAQRIINMLDGNVLSENLIGARRPAVTWSATAPA